MTLKTIRQEGSDEFPNVRVYNLGRRNASATCVVSVWISKISCYESPCIVTGDRRLTGLKENPKSTNAKIEVTERGKLLTWRKYLQ